MMFQKGGNAVDAACAMLAAGRPCGTRSAGAARPRRSSTTRKTKKVIGINALGVAPTGATPEFFKQQRHAYPPEYGPLAAVTPGTPGGLMMMLAEYGTLCLKDVLAPAIEMADGYPIEAQPADAHRAAEGRIKQWPYSQAVFLPHAGQAREAPSRARSSGRRISRRRCASSSRPSSRRSRRGQEPQGGDLRRLRSLLQGRHRAGARARRRGAGRPVHDGGSREAGRSRSRSRS